MDNREVGELVDRESIRHCLAQLARGEDRRDAALIVGAYWPTAVVDYGIFTGSVDEYLAWVVPGSPSIRNTQHVLGQSLIQLRCATAFVETHVLAYHRIAGPAEDGDMIIGGRYLDRLDTVDGQWRITRRAMVYDWQRDLGVAVDWSSGLMGAPVDTARYVGRALGDPSTPMLGEGAR
ncbi:nuclear transport factor 2 family protein [Mycolicibacterium sp. P1-5]|uniref:nuclear transport factor 2 family protein n=1 Tax=Mycolicibacterium sp. P1-5 TaxID=2024617 RepID=UPI0011EC5291|nr:nuclear transport factor 2 family protein [Mycolicibacterium sp. P1-5]KAA0111995.1 nuclear transport factor 2 family protein [Mycolicibacterium sp. P1-5]